MQLCMIIPFSYKGDIQRIQLENAKIGQDERETDYFKEKGLGETPSLFNRDKFGYDEEDRNQERIRELGRMVKEFRLDPNFFRRLGLNQKLGYTSNSGGDVNIFVKNVYVLFFDSEIGFFTIEIQSDNEWQEETKKLFLEDILRFGNRRRCFKFRQGNPPEEKHVSFRDFIDEILKIKFHNGNSIKEIYDISYQYKEGKIYILYYELTKNIKENACQKMIHEKNKVRCYEYCPEDDNDMNKDFSYIHWIISENIIAGIVELEHDRIKKLPRNEEFCRGSLAKSVSTTYLVMFMHSIYLRLKEKKLGVFGILKQQCLLTEEKIFPITDVFRWYDFVCSLSDVYISYRTAGGYSWAKLIYYELKKNQIPVFFDEESMIAGAWHDQLELAIKNSRIIVVVLTKYCLEHTGEGVDRVFEELKAALDQGKYILPVIIKSKDERCCFAYPADIPDKYKEIFCDKHSDKKLESVDIEEKKSQLSKITELVKKTLHR